MKFKPRLPLPQSHNDADPVAEDVRPDERHSDEEVETKKSETAGGDVLGGAFEALAKVVRAEMETLKRSVVGLEMQLTRRIEAEKESVSTAIGELRRDMIARVETMRQSQQKAVEELSEQSKAGVAALRGQFEQVRDQANSRANEIKSGLEQILAAKEQKIEQELQALTQNLSGVRVDLEQQVANSGKVSALLSNVANVFSDPRSLPSERSQQGRGGDGSRNA